MPIVSKCDVIILDLTKNKYHPALHIKHQVHVSDESPFQH